MTTNAGPGESLLTTKLEELLHTWLQLSPMERKTGLIAAWHSAIHKEGGIEASPKATVDQYDPPLTAAPDTCRPKNDQGRLAA